MIDLEREIAVHPAPHVVGRDDVEHRQPLDHRRNVERHAVGDPGAAIMARHGEAVVAQGGHHRHHVARHGALRIGPVVAVVLRHAGAAVAPEIGNHQVEMAGQHRRQPVPHHMRLGIAVQQ